MHSILKSFVVLIFAIILGGVQVSYGSSEQEVFEYSVQQSIEGDLNQSCVAFFNQASPHTQNNQKQEFDFLLIENERESEDDDEVSTHSKYVKCSKHFTIIYYLANNVRSELHSVNYEYYTEEQKSFAVYELPYIDFQVFRI